MKGQRSLTIQCFPMMPYCFRHSYQLRALCIKLYQHTQLLKGIRVCVYLCVYVCVRTSVYLLPRICFVSVHFQWGRSIHQHPQPALKVKGHIQRVIRKGQSAVWNQRFLLHAKEAQCGQSADKHTGKVFQLAAQPWGLEDCSRSVPFRLLKGGKTIASQIEKSRQCHRKRIHV